MPNSKKLSGFETFPRMSVQFIGIKAKARLLKTTRIKTEIMGDQFSFAPLDRALKAEMLDTHGQTFVSKSIQASATVIILPNSGQ